MFQQALEFLRDNLPDDYPLETISYSSLNEYNTCPIRWRMKYIDRNPPPKTDAMLVGSAVHKGIECFHNDDEDPLAAALDLLTNQWTGRKDKLASAGTSVQRIMKVYVEKYPRGVKETEIRTEAAVASGVKLVSITDLLTNENVVADHKVCRRGFEPDPLQLVVNATTLAANGYEPVAGQVRSLRKDIKGTRSTPIAADFDFEFTEDFVMGHMQTVVKRLHAICASIALDVWSGPPKERNENGSFCTYACSVELCNHRAQL